MIDKMLMRKKQILQKKIKILINKKRYSSQRDRIKISLKKKRVKTSMKKYNLKRASGAVCLVISADFIAYLMTIIDYVNLKLTFSTIFNVHLYLYTFQ